MMTIGLAAWMNSIGRRPDIRSFSRLITLSFLSSSSVSSDSAVSATSFWKDWMLITMIWIWLLPANWRTFSSRLAS